MNQLVIFDLDNTIIKGQSQRLLLNYAFKKKLIKPIFYYRILLWFILYRIGLAKNPKKIMEYAFSFLENKYVNECEKIINDFFNEELQNYIFEEAVKISKDHINQNRIILIISNAIEFIPKRISEFLGTKHFIGTKLAVLNGKFTGHIEGNIIYGEYKVNALKDFIKKNKLSLENSWAYSDHNSDIPLLELATHPCTVNPDRGLLKKAKERNWPTIVFKKTIK